MPLGMAAIAYEAVAKANRAELDLHRTPWTDIGFVNVIRVGKKFQARLQDRIDKLKREGKVHD